MTITSPFGVALWRTNDATYVQDQYNRVFELRGNTLRLTLPSGSLTIASSGEWTWEGDGQCPDFARPISKESLPDGSKKTSFGQACAVTSAGNTTVFHIGDCTLRVSGLAVDVDLGIASVYYGSSAAKTRVNIGLSSFEFTAATLTATFLSATVALDAVAVVCTVTAMGKSTVTQRDSQPDASNTGTPPILFVVRPDGTATELLREIDVSQIISDAAARGHVQSYGSSIDDSLTSVLLIPAPTPGTFVRRKLITCPRLLSIHFDALDTASDEAKWIKAPRTTAVLTDQPLQLDPLPVRSLPSSKTTAKTTPQTVSVPRTPAPPSPPNEQALRHRFAESMRAAPDPGAVLRSAGPAMRANDRRPSTASSVPADPDAHQGATQLSTRAPLPPISSRSATTSMTNSAILGSSTTLTGSLLSNREKLGARLVLLSGPVTNLDRSCALISSGQSWPCRGGRSAQYHCAREERWRRTHAVARAVLRHGQRQDPRAWTGEMIRRVMCITRAARARNGDSRQPSRRGKYRRRSRDRCACV